MKREERSKKIEKKRPIYDNITVSEHTLSLLIVFGLIAAALAMTCGYFMGNGEKNGSQEYRGVPIAETQKASPDGEAFCV